MCEKDVIKFHTPNFHPEFGERASFDIKAGSILAIQQPIRFWCDVDLQQQIGTVFQLVENEEVKPETFEVSLDGDKIQIMMGRAEKMGVDSMRKGYPIKTISLNVCVFPCLN